MRNGLHIGERKECDVLIIGAGGAGLRCAAEILERRPGTKVLAVTKVAHPQKSHTATAQGGLAAVDPNDPIDKPIYHMFDTWKGSDCTADQNIIEKIIESAWNEIVLLENRGMHFSRDVEGGLSKRTFGGHTLHFGESSAYRAVFEADRTGKGIMDTLWGETVKGGVCCSSQGLATELLFDGKRCVGAVVFKPKQGCFLGVLAKVTVLATGGSGQVFRITTNCRQNTGDGLALALQSGIPIMDPEAVQFHPTGIVGPGILASESLRSEGGILRNRNLEPFMEEYAPRMRELAPRDLVARAIESEIRKGRGVLNPDHKSHHVWIDLRHLSDYVHDQKLTEVSSFFKKFLNIDPKKELCPVHPSNHYHMGGIPTDPFGQVQKDTEECIPGLFAVGECAAASFHGFNRLGTNSILELITMGKFAGEKAIQYMGDKPDWPSGAGERTFAQFSRFMEVRGKSEIGEIREALQSLMTEKVGLFRSEMGLKQAVEGLRELQGRADKASLSSKSLCFNQELIQRWELDNLFSVSLVIAQGALYRKESRGAHFREDFPERKDEYNHHTLAYISDAGEVDIGKRPVDMSIYMAEGEHYKKFGFIERKY